MGFGLLGNCCCTPPSETCCDPDFTGDFDVTIAGAAEGTSPCLTCTTEIDGLYTAAPIDLDPTDCIWEVNVGVGTCDDPAVGVRVTVLSDGTDYILTVKVSIFMINRTSNHYFKANLGSTRPDCSAFSGLDVPYDSQEIEFGAGLACDLSGATVTVSAA